MACCITMYLENGVRAAGVSALVPFPTQGLKRLDIQGIQSCLVHFEDFVGQDWLLSLLKRCFDKRKCRKRFVSYVQHVGHFPRAT